MKDTIETLVFWPQHAVKQFIITTAGWIILAIPCIFRFITKGKAGFSNNLDIFTFMSKFPLGLHCFSSLIPFTAPYTGSIEGFVTDLSRKDDVISCSAYIENHSWLRNPFQSVHAVAMTNLGEMASGIAMITAMQCEKGKIRGIVVKISTEYSKKAKGRVFATSDVDMKKLKPNEEMILETVLTNSSGEEVARCFVTWTFSAKENRKNK